MAAPEVRSLPRFWRGFLRSLFERRPSGVQLVVSDAHAGLKKAIGARRPVTASYTTSATPRSQPARRVGRTHKHPDLWDTVSDRSPTAPSQASSQRARDPAPQSRAPSPSRDATRASPISAPPATPRIGSTEVDDPPKANDRTTRERTVPHDHTATRACSDLDTGALREPQGSSARPNTVALSGDDGDGLVGGLGWLGPGVMLGALDRPVAHLAFDDAGVGAEASFAVGLGEDLGECLLMRGRDRVGGKIPAG